MYLSRKLSMKKRNTTYVFVNKAVDKRQNTTYFFFQQMMLLSMGMGCLCCRDEDYGKDDKGYLIKSDEMDQLPSEHRME